MKSSLVYLDNNATTQVSPEARDAMLPFLCDEYANPSSSCTFARGASRAVRTAREQVAGLLSAAPAEVVFTSGGTESNNAALHMALSLRPNARHLVTTSVEHPSVRLAVSVLEERGYRVTCVPVDADGRLDLDLLTTSLDADTALVSVMAANNETGVVFPVAEVSERVRERGILLHVDAVQAAGKLPIDVSAWGVDFLSVSGHKFHGPKGVGALFIRKGLRTAPYQVGGEQEQGRRGGTENVPGIAGLGVAAEQAMQGLHTMRDDVRRMRDGFERDVLGRLTGTRVMGGVSERLPNTSHILFEGVEAEALLALLDMQGICCSSGSACTAGSSEPSHVLEAMGVPAAALRSAVRISLSRYTTPDEIDSAGAELAAMVKTLRSRD